MSRKDGKRVKKIDSTHRIMPYLMANRTEAEVYIIEKINITNLMKYLDEENKKSDYKITLFHAVITALAKTIYNRPLLNRFIAGRRYYDRYDVSFGFVAKNKLSDKAEERLIILNAKENMNLKDISKKVYLKVQKTRDENTNEMNDTLGIVTSFPRCITSLIMWAFRKLDFYGLVPQSISKTDPNYTSVLISNLGSIGSDCCYHHLNNYGTNSIVSTIGIITEENNQKYVNISFTLDERIADGFYFAKSVKLFKYILENPELLEDKLKDEVTIKDEKK